jgi:hypothetical protein
MNAVRQREASRTPSGRRRDLPPPIKIGDPVTVNSSVYSRPGRVVAIEHHPNRANFTRIQVRTKDGRVEWYSRDRIAFAPSKKYVASRLRLIQESWRNPLMRETLNLPPRQVDPTLVVEPLTAPVMSVRELIGIIQSCEE